MAHLVKVTKEEVILLATWCVDQFVQRVLP